MHRVPSEEALYELAELFKVFGDSTRVRILYALYGRSMGVNELAEALGLSQSATSHQLKALRAAKLVRSKREGKSVIYSLADGHVVTILAQGMEHVEE